MQVLRKLVRDRAKNGLADRVHDVDTSTFFEQIRSLFASINLRNKQMSRCSTWHSRCYPKSGSTLCPFGLEILAALLLASEASTEATSNSFSIYAERSSSAARLQRIAVPFNQVASIFAPYAQSQVLIDHFLERDWRALNMTKDFSRVQLKAVVRRAFHSQISSAGTIDTHSEAFKSTGLNSLISEVVRNKSINFKQRRNLNEILIDWRLKRTRP